MKLLNLVVENYRGAPNGNYSFSHPTTREPLPVVLITGEPCCGKTSVLEAIATLKEIVGGYGPPPSPARLLRRGAQFGLLAGTWLLSKHEMERAKTSQSTWVTEAPLSPGLNFPQFDVGLRSIFETYAHDAAIGKFEYFASNRRLPRDPIYAHDQPVLPPAVEAELRLSKHPDKYIAVQQTLVAVALADSMKRSEIVNSRGILIRSSHEDSLAPYKRATERLLRRVRLEGVELRGSRPVITFTTPNGGRVEIADLSEGEQQAVLLSVTFQRLGLNHSVVLIDEPELHLHPDDQAEIVQHLSALGVDNQIIAATSSVEVLRATPQHQVVRLP